MREKVGFRQVVAQIAEKTGEKPPEFGDHTPFSNKGIEDLLKLNKLVSTVRTEIIPPRSNKDHKGLNSACTDGCMHECNDGASTLE